MRTHILTTLLWKEALRFRYNWGLLVMIGGVLALSVLLSISARLGQLPGQDERLIQSCILLISRDSPTAHNWLSHLLFAVPSPEERTRAGLGDFSWHYGDAYRKPQGGYDLPFRCLGIGLF